MSRDTLYDHSVWLRSKRIFHSDDGWYVDTREHQLGPYRLRQTAVIELKRYLRELNPQLAQAASSPSA